VVNWEFWGKIGTIFGIISFVFMIFQFIDSNNQISDLKSQLDQAKQDLINNGDSNRDQMLMAVYEVNYVGMDEKLRDSYFKTKFGYSYSQVTNLLDTLNKTDDYSLGISGLSYGDYDTSLYHFNVALIKNPNNVEYKVGKSAALIGLNKTSDARTILFEIEPGYPNKAYIENLLGDAYYKENDFKNATESYVKSLGLYFSITGPKDLNGISTFSKICEIKFNDLYDSPDVNVQATQDGWKRGEVIIKEQGIAIVGLYKVT
jgi:tetratricopeptide (TPR) repeat protein